MAKTPEDTAPMPDNSYWVKSVRAQSAQEDPARDKEIRALIDGMLKETVTTELHEGDIQLAGGKPRWERTEQVKESLMNTLMRGGGKSVEKAIRGNASGEFVQFGILTQEGMVLDGPSGGKATYFPRQAMDSAVADAMVGLPPDSKIPFCTTFNTQEIPRVKKALKEFFKTENGSAPILAFLPLLAGQQEIPAGKEYEPVRSLKTFLENEVDFVKVHCPDNATLEADLNQKLKKQHAMCLAVALYLSEFNNVNEMETLVFAPLVGGIMGTGVALGVNSIHLKSPMQQGLVYGGLLAAADAGDNLIGAVPEIVAGKRNGRDLKKLIREYGANAIGGAAAGAIFDIIGGEIFAHGEGVWKVTGAALMALMTSLGFANNAKSKQDDNTQAYRELLRDKRIPPSAILMGLQQQKTEIEKSSTPAMEKEEQLRTIDKQIEKETKDYTKALGMLETVAGKTTKHANFAMLATPAYGLISPALRFGMVPLQLALLAGSETYNLAIINSTELLMNAFGRGSDNRLKKKLAAGEEITLLDLPKTRGAMQAQRLSYALGYVGQVPIKAFEEAKKFTKAVAEHVQDKSTRTRE